MRISRNVVAIVGVAGVAFTLGHLQVFSGGQAAMADPQDAEDMAKMQAYMKAGTPGKHHKKLEPLVGEFDATFKIWMEPGEEAMLSEGTVKREWILDGRYVKETVEATSAWGTFTGLGLIGYNNVDGNYEVAWVDSMSTGIYTEQGIYDPDHNVIKTFGSHRDPASGKLIHTTGKWDLSEPDDQHYVGYIVGEDGRKFKHFEGRTTRQQ